MSNRTIRLLAVASVPEGKTAVQNYLGELKNLFQEESDNLEIVGVAYNKRAAIRQIDSTSPDIILVDLMLVGLRSIEIIAYATGTQPDVKILALCPGDPLHDRVILAIQAGALGFVTKESDPPEILAAINKVLRGEHHLPLEETFDILQLAAPELAAAHKNRQGRLVQLLLGFVPLAGIASALTAFLWREYWGQIGARVSDLGVDASSRVTEFLISILVFLGIVGPLVFISAIVKSIASGIDERPRWKNLIDKVQGIKLGNAPIGKLLCSSHLAWFVLAAFVLSFTLFIDISGGRILNLSIGSIVALLLLAHVVGIEDELPTALKLTRAKSRQALAVLGSLLVVLMFAVSAEVFFLGPDLRQDGLHGYLAPRVLDFSARPVMIYDLDEKHQPLGALYLGGNADLYVLYDPCKETVRFIPVGSSRVEVVSEINCTPDPLAR